MLTTSEKLQLLQLVGAKTRSEVEDMLHSVARVAVAMDLPVDILLDDSPKKQSEPEIIWIEGDEPEADFDDALYPSEPEAPLEDKVEDKEGTAAPEEKFVPRLKKILDETYKKKDPLERLYAEQAAIRDVVNARFAEKLQEVFLEIDEELGLEPPSVKAKVADTLETLVVEKLKGVEWPEAKDVIERKYPIPWPKEVSMVKDGIPFVGMGSLGSDSQIIKDTFAKKEDLYGKGSRNYVTAEEVMSLIAPEPTIRYEASGKPNQPLDLTELDRQNMRRIGAIIADLDKTKETPPVKESSVGYTYLS